MKHLVPAVAAALAGMLAAAPAAFPAPITYTDEFTASGSLNGVSFTDADLVVTMNNDTTNVIPGPFAGEFQNIGTATVSVSGVGTDSFADTVAFVSATSFVCFCTAPFSGDLFDVFSPAFASYIISDPIGPVTGELLAYSGPIPTTGGTLNVASTSADGTFTASIETAVPEPSSLALLGAAFGGLGLRRRRRRT